jgi:hypothetical protein
MAPPDVDIMQERVGPFRIDQEFQAPLRIVDKDGHELVPGDAAYFAPYRDVSVVLEISTDTSGTTCSVAELLVEDTSGATLDGTPLAEVSLSHLLRRLAEQGVVLFREGDGMIHLSHATLVVFADRVEKVWLGGAPREPKWRVVNDPVVIQAIVRAAAATDAQGTATA